MSITWASPCAPPPWLRAKASPKRGARARGLTYEARVAAQLPGTIHGQWFQYRRGLEGRKWCQPDLLWVGPKDCIVLECKLTDTPAALTQLEDLYLPVVRLAFRLPTFGIVVTKNLTPKTQLLTSNLVEALACARSGLIPTLHWRGLSLLVPPLMTKGVSSPSPVPTLES